MHVVLPPPGLVGQHYLGLYVFVCSYPWRNFTRCKIHFASQVLRSPTVYGQRYCTTLEQRASTKICGVLDRNGITELSQRAPPIFGRGRSRWASAHILVACVSRVREVVINNDAFSKRIVSAAAVAATIACASELIPCHRSRRRMWIRRLVGAIQFSSENFGNRIPKSHEYHSPRNSASHKTHFTCSARHGASTSTR